MSKRLTIDRFDAGLLLARPSSVAPANSLSVLRNMDVQPGGWLRSRPKFKTVNATAGSAISIDPRWKGLEANGGHLWVFGAHNCADPAVSGIQLGITGGGVSYLMFAFRSTGSGGAFTDAAALYNHLLGVTPWENGFVAIQRTSSGVYATKYAPSTPFSPTATAITDGNCPKQLGIMVTAKSRVFAASDDGQTVRFSKIGDPTDWTAAGSAGFIPVAQHFSGSTRVYGLGMYQDKLAVFGESSVQLWNIAADPTAMALDRVITGVGTRHHRSIRTLNGDTLFLSESGVRSITTLNNALFPTDVDMGLPVRSMMPSPPLTRRDIGAVVSGVGSKAQAPSVDSLAASPFAQYWVAAPDYWSN